MKKTMALILTLAIMLTMVVPVHAEDPAPEGVSVQNVSGLRTAMENKEPLIIVAASIVNLSDSFIIDWDLTITNQTTNPQFTPTITAGVMTNGRSNFEVVEGGSLTIKSVKIEGQNSAAHWRGGISVNGGALVLENVTLTRIGTSVINAQNASITIKNCTFGLESTGILNYGLNSRTNGGAINATNCNVTIENTKFEYCTAAENGGAIYANGGTVTIKNSSFGNNTAQEGNAIYATTGTSVFISVDTQILTEDIAGEGTVTFVGGDDEPGDKLGGDTEIEIIAPDPEEILYLLNPASQEAINAFAAVNGEDTMPLSGISFKFGQYKISDAPQTAQAIDPVSVVHFYQENQYNIKPYSITATIGDFKTAEGTPIFTDFTLRMAQQNFVGIQGKVNISLGKDAPEVVLSSSQLGYGFNNYIGYLDYLSDTTNGIGAASAVFTWEIGFDI